MGSGHFDPHRNREDKEGRNQRQVTSETTSLKETQAWLLGSVVDRVRLLS
jgi:hypothetical protein